MLHYRADYIDGTPRYFKARSFDAFMAKATLPRIGRPVRIFTITRTHYREATR